MPPVSQELCLGARNKDIIGIILTVTFEVISKETTPTEDIYNWLTRMLIDLHRQLLVFIEWKCSELTKDMLSCPSSHS